MEENKINFENIAPMKVPVTNRPSPQLNYISPDVVSSNVVKTTSYMNPETTELTTIPATIMNAILSKEEEEKVDVKPIGLFDDLSEEDKEKAIETAKENLLKNDAYNIEKNLKRDNLTVPRQKYCVVSWSGPTFRAKTEKYGMRIMGAFPNLKSANNYAKKVNKHDPTYDIGVMEMNLWCLGYPDISDFVIVDGKIDQQKSQEKVDGILNDFIIKHKTEIEESVQLFRLRTVAVRKSKMTVEGNIENAEIDKIPEGQYTKEMEKIHQKEASKWIKEESVDQEEESVDQEEESVDKSHELDQFVGIKIIEQEYAVISYVGNEGKNKRIPISIKGVFSKQEEAEDYILKYMKLDDTFDMLVAPLYKWILCDPDLSNIRQRYMNEELNNLLEAEENQKEESMNLHESKINGTNLDNPLNTNYKGKGSHLNAEYIDDEEDDEEYMASNLLYDLAKDANTKSYTTKNTEDNNVILFESLIKQITEKEKEDEMRFQE